MDLPSDFEKTGFIAQKVQKVIPDAVTEREDGYLELNVDPIHWAVVNAIQDLWKKFVSFRSQILGGQAELQKQLELQPTEIELLKKQNELLRLEIEEIKKKL